MDLEVTILGAKFNLDDIYCCYHLADISKTLDTKRKRLESFTQAAVKTSNRKERFIHVTCH